MLKCAPTATHVDVLAHEIADSVPRAMIRVTTVDQLLPFHRWTKSAESPPDDVPTVKQVVTDGHEIPVRRLSAAGFGSGSGSGLATTAQRVPSQRSMRALGSEKVELLVSPTAKHIVTLGHATQSDSVLEKLPVGLAVATIDHVLPFQRSASLVALGDDAAVDEPMAKQLTRDAHEDTRSACSSPRCSGSESRTMPRAVPTLHQCPARRSSWIYE